MKHYKIYWSSSQQYKISINFFFNILFFGSRVFFNSAVTSFPIRTSGSSSSGVGFFLEYTRDAIVLKVVLIWENAFSTRSIFCLFTGFLFPIKQVDGGFNISESESEVIDGWKGKAVDRGKEEVVDRCGDEAADCSDDEIINRCGDETADRSEAFDCCVEAIDCCDGGGVSDGGGNTCR